MKPGSTLAMDWTAVRLECDGCGKAVRGTAHDAVVTLSFSGRPEVHCPRCARRSFEFRAAQWAAQAAARTAGGQYVMHGQTPLTDEEVAQQRRKR